jgi:hypothetical protein
MVGRADADRLQHAGELAGVRADVPLGEGHAVLERGERVTV